MKTIESGMTSELDGALADDNLTIEANGKAFKELISGIYSDKAYAIARETFANGIDSHVQAGIPERPIRVHVPSFMEPHYAIRDYGVSMDHHTVMTLYRTLFRSSKDDPNSEDSNKYVGKFGLGSKSPFAYTDSFQLTTYLDGVSRMYDVFFNAGRPKIALLAEVETTEENGVLVTFGVNPKDVKDFTRAIKRAAEGLEVLPIIEGDSSFEFHTREIVAEGDGWRLQNGTQSGKAEARQGTVLYPLNFEAVIDCPVELKNLFDQPFRFDFPIGSLDIVTSREALSYDVDTSNNIIERLKAVQADIMARIAQMIEGSKTYWEFCRAYQNATQTFPEHRFGKLIITEPTFKSRKPKSILEVKTNNIVVPMKRDDKGEVVQEHKVLFRFGSLTYSKIKGTDFSKAITFREDRDRRSNVLTLDISKRLIVVTEDVRQKNRYPAARIRKVIDEQIKKDPNNYRDTVLLWFRHQGESEYALNRMFAAFGRPDMELINLLDVPHHVAPRQYSSGPRMPYKVLDEHGNWKTPSPSDDVPEEAFYVSMRNGDVDFLTEAFSAPFMAEIMDTLVALGVDKAPILGIPASSKRILAENPQWIEFYPYVASIIGDLFDADAYRRVRYNYGYRETPSLISLVEALRGKVTASDMKDAFNGSMIDQIMREWKAFAPKDGDDYQATVIDIWSRFEDRRITKAKAFNLKLAHDVRCAGGDSLPESILKSEVNAAHEVRREFDAFRDTNINTIKAMCEEVYLQFPLFRIMSTYDLDRKDVASDVLNYVFNKRLMEVEQPKEAVDTAEAA